MKKLFGTRVACQKKTVGTFLLAAGLVSSGLASAATITVTNSTDTVNTDSSCSLREAIINANNNDQSGSTDCAAGESLFTPDIIVFDTATNGVPIVLTRTGSDNAADLGDLDILDNVIISGNGADSITEIDGNATDRVFEVRSGADVQMLELAVTNGGNVSSGAGIRVFDGSLTMQDAKVFANNINVSAATNSGSGAGISTSGNVMLTRVSIVGNSIQASDTRSGFGAGIYVGGGGLLSMSTSLVKDNTITSTNGSASGAGLYTIPTAGAETGISSSVFEGNQAIATGDGGAAGGAINHQSGTLSISRGVFIDNLVRKTTANVSSPANGGAIQVFNPVEIRESTFSGNRAESVDSASGGALVLNGVSTLNNVTITDNQVQASSGANASGGGLRSNNSVTISNSLIAGNSSNDDGPDCSGTITSAGYNLVGDNSQCGFSSSTGDLVGDVATGGSLIDPRLAPLADNGGSFMVDTVEVAALTHAPLSDSPAIDAGDPNEPGAGGTCGTIDQTGYGRPVDGDGDGGAVCDIGSVEFREGLGSGEGGSGGGTASFDGGSGGGGGALSPLFLLSLVGVAAWLRRGRLRA